LLATGLVSSPMMGNMASIAPCCTQRSREDVDGVQKPGPPRKQSIGTPFSQASTAPPSPDFMSLKQPMESSDEDETSFRFERLSSGCSDLELVLPILPIFTPEELQEEARACIGMPPLQSELAKWAQWRARWEQVNGTADGFFDSDVETGSECATDSLVGTGNEEEEEDEERHTVEQILPIFTQEELQEEPRVSIGMMPLQSELGKWAQWQARWEQVNGTADGFFDSDFETGSECATDSLVGTGNEEEEEDEECHMVEQILPIFTKEELQEEPRVSIGIMPLQSELGKWAQWQLRWEQANDNDGCDNSDDEFNAQDDSVECAVGPILPIFSEDDLKDEPCRSFGVPPLQSELGKWAQWQIQWEAANGNDTFLDGNAK